MQAIDYLLPLVRTLLQTTVEAGKSSEVTCSFEMVQKVCGFVCDWVGRWFVCLLLTAVALPAATTPPPRQALTCSDSLIL